MRKTRIWLAILFAALLLPATARMQAQEAPGKIHGHVQDPLGVALKGGSVILSTDGGQTAKYTLTTDDNGNYTGDNVAPGTYTVVYRNADTPPGKFVDEFQNVKITSGTDLLLNFDMSRPEYLAKMTPEQKKQFDELKSKNAEVVKSNLVIKTMNADLLEARVDNAKGKSGNCIDAQNHSIYGKADAAACTAAGGKVNNPEEDYQQASTLMTKDLTGLPKELESGEPLLLVEQGVAYKGLKKFDDAVTSLKKAIDLETASKSPRYDVLASAYDALGETLVQQNKIPEAQAAYDSAAQAAVKIPQASPKSAAQYYTNEAIMMDRAGNIDATVAAADKAIAADPDKPLPYYLKGKALINKATVDPKTQKIVAPPGCAEAYQKYL
ncbi:MAG TPA: carboxypeptidase regulatory-like domain-containing protein, partial [Silvibacterium sp.]|nr:carboxypeptidase regulatory-like domain-containing protein [Silvibacterium sp.]